MLSRWWWSCVGPTEFTRPTKSKSVLNFSASSVVSFTNIPPHHQNLNIFTHNQNHHLFCTHLTSLQGLNFEIWEIIPNLSTAHATFVKTSSTASSTQSKKTHFSFLPRRSQNWRPGNNRALFLTCRALSKKKEKS